MLSSNPGANEILSKYRNKRGVKTASAIYRQSLPPGKWWKAVSQGAKSDRPFWDAAKKIAVAHLEDSTLPIWPPAMYEIADELPPITKEEAWAILEKFMRLEIGRAAPGILLYKLHWDLLTSQFCPLRGRYQVLQQLVADDALLEPVKDNQIDEIKKDSRLHWPLTITESILAIIRKEKLKSKLPTFCIVEDFLSDLMSSYPNILKIILWMIVGGGIYKFLDFAL